MMIPLDAIKAFSNMISSAAATASGANKVADQQDSIQNCVGALVSTCTSQYTAILFVYM